MTENKGLKMACILESVLSLAVPYKLIENTVAVTNFIYKCFRPVF